MAFSPDGTKIITSDSHTANIWDINGKLLAHLLSSIQYVEFNEAEDTFLTSTGVDARLWDSFGNLLTVFQPEAETTWLSRAYFNFEESTVLGVADSRLYIWPITYNLIPTAANQSGFHGVATAVFSADGQYIATANRDWTVQVWNKDGYELNTIEGHNEPVENLTISPDGNIIATVTHNTARLWQRDGTLISILEGHTNTITSVLFDKSGTRLLTVSNDATARLWNSTSGELIMVLSGHVSSGYPVLLANFSPDGNFIVTAGCDEVDSTRPSDCVVGTARLWDNNGNLIAVLPGHEANHRSVSNNVRFLSFSPAGNIFITTVLDSQRIWNYEGRLLAVLEGGPDWINMTNFSPDGNYYVAAGITYGEGGTSSGSVSIWDSSGNIVINLQGHGNEIVSARFSPDSTRFITGADDNTARLWQINNGALIATLEGHTGKVLDALFSPSGNQIISVSEDSTARLWGSGGNPLTTFEGHQSAVYSAVFSPDGTRAITIDQSGKALLWEIYPSINLLLEQAGKRLSSLVPVYVDCFSPDYGDVIPECTQNKYNECLTLFSHADCGEQQGIIRIGEQFDGNIFYEQSHAWLYYESSSIVDITLNVEPGSSFSVEIYDTHGQILPSDPNNTTSNYQQLENITLEKGYRVVVRDLTGDGGDYTILVTLSKN